MLDDWHAAWRQGTNHQESRMSDCGQCKLTIHWRRWIHAMQVYHMPGQSDNFVTAFRTWLQKHGGGGPWGPMDASWLQVTHHAPVSTPGHSSAVASSCYTVYTASCRMLLSSCYRATSVWLNALQMLHLPLRISRQHALQLTVASTASSALHLKVRKVQVAVWDWVSCVHLQLACNAVLGPPWILAGLRPAK